MNTAIKEQNLKDKILRQLHEVKDPEIPFISIVDLGMITGVEISEDKTVTVTMTPTFAACPAIEVLQQSIKNQIRSKIKELNVNDVEVKVTYEVQWNSNRITEKGKKILKEFGLAPPPAYEGEITESLLQNVPCPFCDSTNTEMQSTFGSTLCRAIHYCNACRQTFEQFKPL